MPASTYNSIEFSIENQVARLTLNRPDKLNSFTEEMHREIRSALLEVQSGSEARCLLINGNGRGFCAGQDLADLDFSSLGDTLEENYNPLIRSITGLDMPVVCAVNGVAAGAGANLALACDLVIAARSASFIQAFCKIGLVPDAAGSWSLPRLVGLPRAMGMAMLGEKIPAEKAAEWGLIWQCVEDDALESMTSDLANFLATQPTTALALTKRLLRESSNNTLDQQLDLERDFQAAASQTNDFRLGVDAFLAKKAPLFTGK